jgi:kynurenine formamidase
MHRSVGPVVVLFVTLIGLAASARAQEPDKATKEDIARWSRELSNWGRWGKDDQLGVANLITPAKRKQAAALVKEGVSVSLARDLETDKSEYNPSPFKHSMIWLGSPEKAEIVLDTFEVNYHGFAHTHLDALCHFLPGGKMYNGFGRDQITPKGAAKNSILALKNGVFTRGILFDIPRLKGLPYLEPGTPIYPRDLEQWETKAGIKGSAGDVIFIRTGRWALQKRTGPWNVGRKSAGLYASCLPWIRHRDLAMIGSDAATDLIPSGVEGAGQPIHEVALAAFGMHIFDNCDLEELSQTAARYNRWEFLLTAAPLRVVGGTGSPLNPIATY